VNERDAERAESELRRALASLDGIAAPTLSALGARRRTTSQWRAASAFLATAVVVLVAAVAIGSGLAAWRADHAATAAATGSPNATANASASARSATPSASVSVTVTLPTECPPETLPELKNDRYPQGNEHGGATPSAAFIEAYPSAGPPPFTSLGTASVRRYG